MSKHHHEKRELPRFIYSSAGVSDTVLNCRIADISVDGWVKCMEVAQEVGAVAWEPWMAGHDNYDSREEQRAHFFEPIVKSLEAYRQAIDPNLHLDISTIHYGPHGNWDQAVQRAVEILNEIFTNQSEQQLKLRSALELLTPLTYIGEREYQAVGHRTTSM
jgi:hypothetical protein